MIGKEEVSMLLLTHYTIKNIKFKKKHILEISKFSKLTIYEVNT